VLFISHDFGVVRYFAQGYRIAVLYFGVLVEEGPCEDVIDRPQHPYTYMLLSSVPVPDPKTNRRRTRFISNLGEGPIQVRGCPFVNRCNLATNRCREEMPTLRTLQGTHRVACFYPEQVPSDLSL